MSLQRQPPDSPQRPHRPWAWMSGGLLLLALLMGLGCWQLQRLAWKEALIARIEQRRLAAPQALPAPAAWADISRDAHEYLTVRLSGVFDHDRETLVQASTVLGPGWWVLTPLRLDSGDWVLVNRGFVDASRRVRTARDPEPIGPVQIQGLIRLTEPEGRLWQSNDAVGNRWYSRDVQMLASARGLHALGGQIAPFFVDQAEPGVTTPSSAWPRPGLTVLNFRNNHRMYAFTWFTLAAMVAAGLVMMWRHGRQPDAEAAHDTLNRDA